MDFGLGDEAVDPYSPVARLVLPLRTTRAGGEALARPLLNIDYIRHTINHISKLSIQDFQQLLSLPKISPFTVSDEISTSFKGTELR